MIDLTKILKLGDPVESYHHGSGVVEKFSDGDFDHKICIRFGRATSNSPHSSYSRWYTITGRFEKDDLRPDIYPAGTVFPNPNWKIPAPSVAINIDPQDAEVIRLYEKNINRDALEYLVRRDYFMKSEDASDYLDALLADYHTDERAWWRAHHYVELQYDKYIANIRTPEMDTVIRMCKRTGVLPEIVDREISQKMDIDTVYANHYRRVVYAEVDKQKNVQS